MGYHRSAYRGASYLSASVLILTLVISGFGDNIPNYSGQDIKYTPSPIYHLRGWGGSPSVPGLVNYKPGTDDRHIIKLYNESYVDLSINVIGKVYEEGTDIWVLLSMNSMNSSGKTVHLRLLFDYDNDGDYDTIVNFPSYTTESTFSVENFTFKPTGKIGIFEDFPGMDPGEEGGRRPGGNITLRIWRSDERGDSFLIINCGAQNRASHASIPYYRGTAAEEIQDGGYIVEILAGVVITLGIIYLFLKGSGKKTSDKKKGTRRVKEIPKGRRRG